MTASSASIARARRSGVDTCPRLFCPPVTRGRVRSSTRLRRVPEGGAGYASGSTRRENTGSSSLRVEEKSTEGLSHADRLRPREAKVPERMDTTTKLGCNPASIATGLLLEALGADDAYDYLPVPGLPGSTVYVAERAALIAVTSAAAPMFAANLERNRQQPCRRCL